MADQSQRLEIATVRAEVGSNIVYRFTNDAANADSIPTESGNIQNLKQVVLEIQQEAADKISISTTIYPTVAQGLSATADQGIFLVQSSDADEIYSVWQNQAGTAVNTGKTALSATAIQTALDASNEAARAAEDAADVATSRTAGFLAPAASAPEVRDNGLPLEAGDRYFNTEEQAEYIYTDAGWEANDSQQAITDLGNENDPTKGAAGIGFDGAKVDELLLNAKSLPDYSALRAYTGRATGIKITNPGVFGDIYRDPSVTKDNGGTEFLDGLGRGWRRRFTGNVNVAWFDDKETTHNSAFSRAAKAAPAVVNTVTQVYPGVPRALFATIDVPDGSYLLTELLDVGNKEISWRLSSAAIIEGIDYINGSVVRPGSRTTKRSAFNTADYAVAESIIIGGDKSDRSPAVTGVANTSQLASYPDRDKVGLFVSARPSKPVVDSDLAVYTASTVASVPLTPDQLKLLRVGMVIDTKHATRWSGFLSSWNSDGSVLTVLEWRPAGGNTNTPLPAGVPDNDSGFRVNAFTKLWAQNTTAHLTLDGSEDALIAHEFSLYNTRRDFSDYNLDAIGNSYLGQLMSLAGGSGYYKGTAGYVVSGPWKYGFAVRGITGVETGFHYQTTLSSGTGFSYRGGGRPFVSSDLLDRETFTLSSSGNIQVGASTSASTKYFDWRTSGNGNSYDYRLEISGGGAVGAPGGATVRHLAIDNAFAGVVRPTSDNLRSLGTAPNRWSEVRAGNGTILTSDERVKVSICEIPDDVLDAWQLVDFQAYKFVDSVERKGDSARWHFGVVAQKVRAAFESKGINAFEYGVLCYDEWEGTESVVDEQGNEVVPSVSAGSLYGIRYDQALVLEAALMRRKLRLLEEQMYEILGGQSIQ